MPQYLSPQCLICHDKFLHFTNRLMSNRINLHPRIFVRCWAMCLTSATTPPLCTWLWVCLLSSAQTTLHYGKWRDCLMISMRRSWASPGAGEIWPHWRPWPWTPSSAYSDILLISHFIRSPDIWKPLNYRKHLYIVMKRERGIYNSITKMPVRFQNNRRVVIGILVILKLYAMPVVM